MLRIRDLLTRYYRLKLFWYDDLRHYNNERSLVFSSLPQQIEAAWQNWELAQIDVAALQQVDVKDALIKRAAEDLDPPLSSSSCYICEEMSKLGYCHLLAIACFFLITKVVTTNKNIFS